MDISTIHSFCQNLIRQEFQAAEADPLFTVCDQYQAKRLFSESYRFACSSLQKERHTDYLHWKKCFNSKDTEEIIRNVYKFIMSLPNPFEWLKYSCNQVPLQEDPDHPWFKTAAEIIREKIGMAQIILRRQFLMFQEPEHGEIYRSVWKADNELFHVKQLWAEGKRIPDEKNNAGFIRLPNWSRVNSLEAAWKERYVELRKQLKTILDEINHLICLDSETAAKENGNMRESLQGLKVIALRTAEYYSKRKEKLRVLDLNDLEHFALKILRSEPAGTAIRNRYSKVFVDECQDVSRVQNEIIQRLSSEKGHLFMVGDIKQSIYRFRLADPELFLSRMREYDCADSEGTLLELQTNFRSRPEILETANTVFRDIMREETAKMNYTDREALIPGRTAEDYYPVEVDILEPDPERTKLEIVADELAFQIHELTKDNYSFRDIVILMPQVSRDGSRLADLLEERGIPVFFDSGEDFYARPEIELFIQLLTLIDNPEMDQPLISVLKNTPFFFSDEELARIRMIHPDKNIPFHEAFLKCLKEETEIGSRCREADEKIETWRKLSSFMSLGYLVRYICSDSYQIAMAGLESAGNEAQKNLQRFCRKAEEAEKRGIYTLSRFLSFVSKHAGGGDQQATTSLAEGDNIIRIMTIHKSKGLQFPVVFCLGLDGSISHQTENSVLLDAELGICLKYKRPEFRLSRDTAVSQIFAWKKECEQRAERIRLLYVAMTRAQQRMFLVSVGEDNVLWHIPAGLHRVLSAASYMDWIMPALYDSEKLSTSFPQGQIPWKIINHSTKKQEVVEKKEGYPQLRNWLDLVLSSSPVEDLWKDLQTKPLLSRMQKKSVTSLLRREESGLEEETPESKRIPERFLAVLEKKSTEIYPAFMRTSREMSRAWLGTLNHRFLSLVDLDRIRNAGKKLLPVLHRMKEEMTEKHIFTLEESAEVRVENVACFFLSSIGNRMLSSPEVHREWGFNLFQPERGLLVQGVVDSAFIEGDGWILVDYKTDRIENENLFVENYTPQLQWYSKAVQELTGKPVKEAWLYALSRRKAYRIMPKDAEIPK